MFSLSLAVKINWFYSSLFLEGRETEGDRNFPSVGSLTHSTNAHNNPGRVKPEPETWNSTQFSHVVGRDLCIRVPYSVAFLDAHVQEAGMKMKQLSHKSGTLPWDICHTKTPPSYAKTPTE